MFVLSRKFKKVSLLCLQERGRADRKTLEAKKHESDAIFWKRQSAVFKAKVERLEKQLKARNADGRYSRVIPITSMENLQ